MSRAEVKLGYTKDDLIAAKKRLDIHNSKLTKAIESENFAEACSAIRAIEDECEHASRIAATLSFKSRENAVNQAPRISRGALTGAIKNGTL